MARLRTIAILLGTVIGLGVVAFLTRGRWLPAPTVAEADPAPGPPAEQVELSDQAQKNLRLTSAPLRPTTHWKTIQVPGLVVDRPGHSDRGVIAPAAAVITQVHRLPGETVRPGEVLFSLKLLSESVQLAQTELFRAAQDVKLAQAERGRIAPFKGASISESNLIEVDNRITRLQTTVKAYRQELLTRGVSLAQLDAVAEGKFVTEFPVVAPTDDGPPLEVQALKVDLGQQVQAGQTLALLADHQVLAIEGRAFRDETSLLERAVKEGWPVEVDFREGEGGDWPKLDRTFRIQYLANEIDPETRTFRFLLPLDNQSRTIAGADRPRLLWRFRPGQRVRLRVRVEKVENVFVLPADAVVRAGAEAYVFRRNGDVFDRKPVHVVDQNAREVVIANDGSVPPGVHVAQTGAAQLNRMLKAQTGTAPKGFHVHADGSVHMNH